MPANRYQEALATFPAPGTGCHPFLLSVSNFGVKAGLTADRIFSDIRQSIPAGGRQVPDTEISEAISKAFSDHTPGTFTAHPRRKHTTPQSKPAPPAKNMAAALKKIISAATIKTDDDLFDASPIKLLDDPRKDCALFLESLYGPCDYLFIGTKFDGETVRSFEHWIDYFNQGWTNVKPHFCINPLTGQAVQTGEKTTFRGKANVKEFRYILVEFDNISKADQISFFSGSRLPVCCLLDSGNKSIHALLDASQMAVVETLDDWRREIKERLFDELLTPLGADPATATPANLSRMPGHHREGKGMQRILWLAGREGRAL